MSGGGLGGAMGGTLGTVLGTALAPETGGASILLPAALGAAGGALGGGVGSAVTGGSNPWGSALTGGIGGAASGLIGGLASGLMSPASDAAATDAATTATSSGVAAPSGVASASGSSFVPQAGGDISYAGGINGVNSGVNIPAPSVMSTGSSGSAADSFLNPSNAAPSANSPSWYQQLKSGLGLGSDPSTPAASNQQYIKLPDGTQIPYGAASKAASSGIGDYLLPAGIALGGISALMPSGSNPINTTNATNAQNSFNAPLPSYNYNRTSTPYTGNWYTYGQRPGNNVQQVNTVTPAARGGLIQKFAMGGLARPIQIPMSKMPERRFAVGGAVPPMANPMASPMGSPMAASPMAAPPQGMMPRPAGMPPAQGVQNPAQQAAQYAIGKKIGMALRHHIKNSGMTPDGIVSGSGGGQDDAVPAKLSQQEYVVPADVTSMLGDGSSNAGGKVLDKMVHNVRAHKISHGAHFPPKAKEPTAYMRKKS